MVRDRRPGGAYSTMDVLQGILNAVDFGMRAQEAVAAPRFSTTSDTIDITNRILRRAERACAGWSTPASTRCAARRRPETAAPIPAATAWR